jgi:hypothetical protein
MRSIFRLVITLAVTGILINSCTPDNDDSIILRDDYLGTWDVNETAGNFAPQFYSVEITAGPGEDEILIEGLYNVPGTQVRVNVNGPSLFIPSQQTAGISFSGSGTSIADLSRINLNFTANDGTGNDQVAAILTP